MIYTEKFKIQIKDIGKENKIKNRAILEILENVACYHSDLVGYGVNNIKDTKVTWILLDWKLKVIKRPTYGQVLTVNTWGKGMNKFFTYRDFEIYDDNNNLCAIATSKWVLIDAEKGKMTRLTEKIIDAYKPENKNVFKKEKMDKIEIPEEFTNTVKYQAIRKDIDINNHMHNLYYLDLAYEALPKEIYDRRPFENVKITYKKEIKLGEKVICQYSEHKGKYVIVIKNEEETTIHAIVELQ